MLQSVKIFKDYFESSYQDGDNQVKAKKLSDEFFKDFIYYTPIHLELLGKYLSTGYFELFYKSIADLKYLIEFSDDFSRYWHFLRGYSGALAKLQADQSAKNSKKVYSYYFNRYGDRRILRNEHWFEKKRWEFLDELQEIYTDDELANFIIKYQRILVENLQIYTSFLMIFITDLKNINQPVPSVKEINKE